MSTATTTIGKKWLYCRVAAQLWFCCIIGLTIAADLLAPNSKTASDFATSAFVAGHLVNQGLASLIYPIAGHSALGSSFDQITHQLFPSLPPNFVGQFRYGPLVALIFSPFACLPVQYALLLWQLFSAACVIYLAVATRRSAGCSAGAVFFAAFAFLPVPATIWGGQFGLVFGLLPLTLGYFWMRGGKPFWAGVAWSFLFLKPQFYPIAFLVAAATAGFDRGWLLKGLLVGSAVMALLFSCCLGFDVFIRWVCSLRASEAILSGSGIAIPNYFIAGVPGAILSVVPASLREGMRLPVYLLAGLLLAVSFHLLWRIQRSQLDAGAKRALLTCSAMFALPLFSPYFLFYDLCIYALAGVVLFCVEANAVDQNCKELAIILWLIVNLYILLAVCLPSSVPKDLLPAILLLFGVKWYQAVSLRLRLSGANRAPLAAV